MRLFVRRYNRYLKRNKLKNVDKGLINFINTHPPKIEHEKNDYDIMCYKYRKNWDILEPLV